MHVQQERVSETRAEACLHTALSIDAVKNMLIMIPSRRRVYRVYYGECIGGEAVEKENEMMVAENGMRTFLGEKEKIRKGARKKFLSKL